MVQVVEVAKYGGPEVLQVKEADVPPLASNEVLVKHHAIGLNFIDTYLRSGLYPTATPPFVLGFEAAGEVIEIGSEVQTFDVGDRVAYGDQLGAYSQVRTVPADRLVRLTESISYEEAASIMLKGMTAHYLLRRSFKVDTRHTILFHAAAGGVGLLACQWAASLGATVIGTVGSEEKAELAKQNGCHHTINYKTENFVDRVKEITDGRGVDVVYDGVGRDTYPGSLDSLRPMGMWVLFGQSSGVIEGFQPGVLAQKGSLFMTRPTLFDYIKSREDLMTTALELFGTIENGDITVRIDQKYPLSEAITAHTDLEMRKTTGATILIP